MITCSFILLSYAPFSFLCNHPSRPTFFGNSFLLSIGCICRNWQGCTSFTSYKNITILSWLTKSSILTLSSDQKSISSFHYMNQFSFEKLVILSIDGSFPSIQIFQKPISLVGSVASAAGKKPLHSWHTSPLLRLGRTLSFGNMSKISVFWGRLWWIH